MVCPDCKYLEKKLCQEYGLPNPEDPFCIATGQTLKIGELNKSNLSNKNALDK